MDNEQRLAKLEENLEKVNENVGCLTLLFILAAGSLVGMNIWFWWNWEKLTKLLDNMK